MRDRNTNCNAMRPTKYQVISSVALPFASVIFGFVLNEGYHPHAMQTLGGRTFFVGPPIHGPRPWLWTTNVHQKRNFTGENKR
jgi:hypothetical protein